MSNTETIIEALLFSTDEPLSISDFKKIFIAFWFYQSIQQLSKS